jgi:hypothetical protein
MIRFLAAVLGCLFAFAPSAFPAAAPAAGRIAPAEFVVVLPAAADAGPGPGRLFLFVTAETGTEPRFQTKASLFGLDVRGANDGQRIVIPATTPGYPERQLGDLAPGDYLVQAVYNLLTEFPRADGHTLWAHMDQWEGQNFTRSPGNLYSEPRRVRVGAGVTARVELPLTNTVPPIVVPADTAWVQRFKFQSPLLSRFWGRPMYLGATVLLPQGYADHPQVRYPVVYLQNHFSLAPAFGFNPAPPTDAPPSWGRQRAEAAAKGQPRPEPPPGTPATGAYANVETGSEFFAAWTAPDFPRMIIVTFQHPTPYFDDSYGVNSPNCGPYGDAIMTELIPEFERRYRTIRAEYARVLTGSSTGGWGSLALQLYHPEFFGGAWAFSPDPVDFRLYYGGVDLYRDENAFREKTTPGLEGGALMNRRSSQRAAILGTQEGRFEWWKHTPVGADGYPLPVWDLQTGKIDRAVVEAMRAHNFDLREFLARTWPQLGPKLVGKLHVYAAATDSFYSNFAVRLLDEFMQGTRNPHEPGVFQYGPPSSRHGWQPVTHAELLQAMARHMEQRADAGDRPPAWRY